MLSNKRIRNCALRIAACLVAVIFMTTTVAWSATEPVEVLIQNLFSSIHTNPKDDLSDLNFLGDLGKIQETFLPSQNAPLVIHIQDAHCNYAAQKNIIRTIDLLSKKYGIHQIALEGAQGPVDIDFFRVYPDHLVKKKVFGRLLKSGELSGTEYLALTSQAPFTLSGLELKPLYDENKKAFLEALEKREAILEKLNLYRKNIQSLKNKNDSPPLQSLDSLQRAFDHGEINLIEKWSGLRALGNQSRISIDLLFPNLAKLDRMKDLKFTSDPKQLRSVRLSLLSVIKDKTNDAQSLNDFLRNILHYQRHEMKEADFKNYLTAKAEQFKIDLGPYREFLTFLEHKNLLGQIDVRQLFRESTQWEETLRQKLIQNTTQKELDLYAKRLKILEALAKTEMTREEWELYSKSSDEFSESSFLNFFEANGIPKASKENPTLDKELLPARRFYTLAVQREQWFSDSIVRMIREKKIKALFLISGGFHTEGIKKYLSRHSTGYVVIAPNTKGEASANRYLNLMRGKSTLDNSKALRIKGSPNLPQVLSLFSPIQNAKLSLAYELLQHGQVGKWIENLKKAGKEADVTFLESIIQQRVLNQFREQNGNLASVRETFVAKLVRDVIRFLSGGKADGGIPRNNSEGIEKAVEYVINHADWRNAVEGRSLGDEHKHSYFDEPIAGRGFLNYRYSLPPQTASEVLVHISSYQERKIASLSFRIVSEMKETENFKLDGIVFIIHGFPFYSLWDPEGNIYLTEKLAEELGLMDKTDDGLSDLVLTRRLSDTDPTKLLRQIWLYWKVRVDLLHRPLTKTEEALKRKLPPHMPFSEKLATILAFFLEVEDNPDRARLRASRNAQFPESYGLNLQHLSPETIETLKEIKKSRTYHLNFLDDFQEKMRWIPEWISIYSKGSYSRLDQLVPDPEKGAEMLFSFLTLLDRLQMDWEISKRYDAQVRAWTEGAKEEIESWQLKDALVKEEPRLYFERLLASKPDRGKLLILGMPWGWWENGNIRQLIHGLNQGKKIDSLLVPTSMEHLLPLYPEFDMSRFIFIESPYQIGWQDRFSLLSSLEDLIIQQGKNVILLTDLEEASRVSLYRPLKETLYQYFRENIFNDEDGVFALTYMDGYFGGDGHLLRGRQNVLVHALANESRLVAIGLDNNKVLLDKKALPGNHHWPAATFGELWDGVLFQGKGSDGGNEERPSESPLRGQERILDFGRSRPVLVGSSLGRPQETTLRVMIESNPLAERLFNEKIFLWDDGSRKPVRFIFRIIAARDEIALDIFPHPEELNRFPNLQFLEEEMDDTGMPLEGTFGRMDIRPIQIVSENGNSPAILFDETHPSRGYRTFRSRKAETPDDHKARWRDWPKAVIEWVMKLAEEELGIHEFYATTPEEIKARYPGRYEGETKPRITEGTMKEYYKRPYRGGLWQEREVVYQDTSTNKKERLWHYQPSDQAASLGHTPEIRVDFEAGAEGNQVANLLKQAEMIERLRAQYRGDWNRIQIVRRRRGSNITVRVKGSTLVIEVPSHKEALRQFEQKLRGAGQSKKKKQGDSPDDIRLINQLVETLIDQRSFILTSGSARAVFEAKKKVALVGALLALKTGRDLAQKIFQDLMRQVKEDLLAALPRESDNSVLGDINRKTIQDAAKNPEQALEKIREALLQGKLQIPLIQQTAPHYIKRVMRLIPLEYFRTKAYQWEQKVHRAAETQSWNAMWEALFQLNVIRSMFETEEWNARLLKAVNKAVNLEFYQPFVKALGASDIDHAREALEANKTEIARLKSNPPLKGSYPLLEKNLVHSLDLMITVQEKVLELHQDIEAGETDLNSPVDHFFSLLFENPSFFNPQDSELPRDLPEMTRSLFYHLAALRLKDRKTYERLTQSIELDEDYGTELNEAMVYEQILELIVKYSLLEGLEKTRFKKSKVDLFLGKLIPNINTLLWEYYLEKYETYFNDWDVEPMLNALFNLDTMAEILQQAPWKAKVESLKIELFKTISDLQATTQAFLDDLGNRRTEQKRRELAWEDGIRLYLKDQDLLMKTWESGFQNWEDQRFGEVKTQLQVLKDHFQNLLKEDWFRGEFLSVAAKYIETSNQKIKEWLGLIQNSQHDLDHEASNHQKSLATLFREVESTLSLWEPWIQFIEPKTSPKKMRQWAEMVQSFHALKETAREAGVLTMGKGEITAHSLGEAEKLRHGIKQNLTRILTQLWEPEKEEAATNSNSPLHHLVRSLGRPGNFISPNPNLAASYVEAMIHTAGRSADGKEHLEALLRAEANKQNHKTVVIFETQAIESLTLAEIELILRNEKSHIFLIVDRRLPAESRSVIQKITDRKKIDRSLAQRLNIIYSQDPVQTIRDRLFDLLTARRVLQERITVVSPREGDFIGGINHILYQGYLPGLAIFAHALALQEGQLGNGLAAVFNREGDHFVYSTQALAENLELEAKSRTLQELAA